MDTCGQTERSAVAQVSERVSAPLTVRVIVTANAQPQ